MTGFVLLCVALGSFFAVVLALALNKLAQFNERTVDDIPEMIRPQNPEIEDWLFDPAVDAELRRGPVPAIFRRKQRIRLDVAAERYRNKYYHVRLLLQWANTEWRDMRKLHSMDEYTPNALENLQTARACGTRFLDLAPLLMVRIFVWRVVLKLDRFLLLPTPNVAGQRKVGSVDLLELYQEFKLAMAEFARTYGEEESVRIRTLL